MMFGLMIFVFSVVSVVHCGELTVTEEAWFEVEIKDLEGPGGDYRGRFTIALFGETAPMTCLNFASLVKGYRKKDKLADPNIAAELLMYKGSKIHRIVPDFVIQMGDFENGDGTGGSSIYGKKFNDEDFTLSHRSSGWVSMANYGKDTNASQFFVLLNKARWLDGKHVVFGKVIHGMDTIRTIGEVPADPYSAVPSRNITVVDCGLNAIDRKYDLTQQQADSNDDI